MASAGHPPPLVAAALHGAVEYPRGRPWLPLGTVSRRATAQAVAELPHGAVLRLLYGRPHRATRAVTRRSVLNGYVPWLSTRSEGHPIASRRTVPVHHLIGDDDRGDDVALLVARLLPARPVARPPPRRRRRLAPQCPRGAEALARTAPGEMDAHDIVLAAWEPSANSASTACPTRVSPPSTARGRRDAHRRGGQRYVDAPLRAPGPGPGSPTDASAHATVEVEPGPRGSRVTLEKRLLGRSPSRPSRR